ncbi:MAG: Rpp14/Pop5 family protein [Candidatus Jordarchaeales archaeon]
MPGTRSVKARRRYIVFQVVGSKGLEFEEVAGSILSELLRIFGELGVSVMELKIIEYDKDSGFGVLRCSHRTVSAVQAGVSLISSISGAPVLVDVRRVTGSLKKARKIVEELKMSKLAQAAGKDSKDSVGVPG